MKNIILLFALSVLLSADSLDNAVIEEMQRAKEEKRIAKEEQKSTEIKQIDSKEDSQDTESKTTNTSTQDSHTNSTQQLQPNTRHSVFNSHEDSQWQQKFNERFFSWFIGGYFSGRYQTRYLGVESDFIHVSLHAGAFYWLTKKYGFRGYISTSYSTFDNKDIFSAGGGIDFFYEFNLLGIFGGVYVDTPIASELLRNPDVIIDAGFSAYLSPNVRIEIKIGYPVAHDSRLESLFVYGATVQYIFKK